MARKKTEEAEKTVKTTAKKTAAKKPAAKKSSAGKAKAPARKRVRFGKADQKMFSNAIHYELYNKMGAHPDTVDGQEGTWFTVWAPNAQAVYVTGDFNDWEPEATPLKKVADMGIWEAFVPGAVEGHLYKYYITGRMGNSVYKADPYAFAAEKRPGNASRIANIENFKWKDTRWINKRGKTDVYESPLAIYEVHPGSWMKHAATEENPEGFYNYRQFAHALAGYVKDMGYTHVELIGIAEHPLDQSWGYQVSGYYAPTSRYGTPQDFQYFVDYMHQQNIGVIFDWVPAHFPKDEFGLANFDGDPEYEHWDPRQGEHPDWGTKIFNFGRPEVKNFLLANALYWIEKFHLDGLRVDAVSSMLYLNYGKQDGQWVANKYGGYENLEAMEFLKHLNSLVAKRNKGVMMIAEESTAWPKITADVEDDGLGFTFKWNMGWMHDFLEYMKLDPYFRKYNHHKMTFSTSYASAEKYILVLSHDEVVHLKCSMVNKMPGLGSDKFENLKAGYAYMLGHQGKMLLFMGQDFGQFREWSEERALDWPLLEETDNKNLQNYVRDLLTMYKKYPALHEREDDPAGFGWINADDNDRSIYSFVRWDKTGKNHLLFVINYTPVARPDYRVGLPVAASCRQILDSRCEKYGGDHNLKKKVYKAVEVECDNQPYSFAYDLPAYGVAVFKFNTVL
ncbi:MAG: 1,4-alpha-glucan branching protein GlgB [Lachnospiraceae bacterium]|nr:1,4-alpha-glucan branching protein GlgB [Lachnospiraceae bacterium]